MELATVREAVNLSNNTKAITPYTLRQVLESYSTIDKVKELIENDEKRHTVENNVREFAVTDSLDRIYDIIKKTLK